MGQWKYPGQVTRIPSNNITMEGVPYPVWAQPNVGPGMMMQPGQDYDFPGADYVDEYPQMQDGGFYKDYMELDLTPEEIEEYRKGGFIVEDISVPELQDGGEGAELNLDLPEQTVYANESKRKLQGSLIDKLSQVKNAYQDYRENAGLTKLRLKNEGVSSIESLKRNIKEYKTQLEEEKKSFDRAQKALNVLQKKDPKTWENKKLKDVMSAQGVDALRSLYKDGKISNESFIDFYNNFGKQFDREAVKTSAEDQVKLEDSWYGKKDKQGRRTWMSNPMNVAKIAQGVAIGAPLAPVAAMAAPTIASGASSLIPAAQTALNASMLGVPGLTANNLLWGAGAYLSANEVMDPKSTTRTSINRAIKDPTLSNIGEATGNTAMTALGFAGIPVKAGVASLADDVTQAGRYLTTQTPLKDTYKINPWAFKPNEANWYRQVGQSAIDDALETKLIREAGEEVSPRMWGEFQDQIKRLQGDDTILDYNERYRQQMLAGRRPNSPYFAKGELFYPMDKKITMTKTGKVSKNPAAKGTADYLIETSLPNESFQPAYVKGMYPGIPEEIGSTAILKPKPALRTIDNFNFYKKDWLKGYKPIEVPKELPGSPNAVSSVDDVGESLRQVPKQLSNFSNTPISNVPKNINELTNTGFKKDPYYHYPRFLEKKQEVLDAINTLEGRKRLQGYIDRNPHLQNKTVDDIINDFKQTNFETKAPKFNLLENKWIIDDDGHLKLYDVDPDNAYNWYRDGYENPSYISIGQNYTPYDAKHILEHEFAHLFQRDDQIAGVDDVLATINLKKDKDLNRISLKDFLNNYNPFVKKIEDVGYSANGYIYGTGTNSFLRKKQQKDYWNYGSNNQEKAAFAAEVRENLLQRNILKNRYDPITPEMLEKHFEMYQNTKRNKYNLRLYEIMTKDKNNFKILSEALNRMPAVIPPVAIVGAGLTGAGLLEQKKNGGFIEAELSDKEIKDLKAQGYIIEEIN
jgi:hypothetical protein